MGKMSNYPSVFQHKFVSKGRHITTMVNGSLVHWLKGVVIDGDHGRRQR